MSLHRSGIQLRFEQIQFPNHFRKVAPNIPLWPPIRPPPVAVPFSQIRQKKVSPWNACLGNAKALHPRQGVAADETKDLSARYQPALERLAQRFSNFTATATHERIDYTAAEFDSCEASARKDTHPAHGGYPTRSAMRCSTPPLLSPVGPSHHATAAESTPQEPR